MNGNVGLWRTSGLSVANNNCLFVIIIFFVFIVLFVVSCTKYKGIREKVLIPGGTERSSSTE